MVKFDIKTGEIENTEEELIVLERLSKNAPTSRKFTSSPDEEPFFTPEGNEQFEEDMKFLEKYNEELCKAIGAARREEVALRREEVALKRKESAEKRKRKKEANGKKI